MSTWLATCGSRLAHAVLLAVLAQSTSGARADFFLDDFLDDAAITPFPVNTLTNGVGDASAARQVVLQAGRTGDLLVGNYDIGVTRADAISVRYDEVRDFTPYYNTPLLTWDLRFHYTEFGPTDITQSGVNNAVLVDFPQVYGPYRPSLLLSLWSRLVTGDNRNTGVEYSLPLIVSEPFTAAIGFGEFTGQPGFSFESVYAANVSLVYREIPITTEDFGFQIDAIRFGVVPEPSVLRIALVGLLAVGPRQRRV